MLSYLFNLAWRPGAALPATETPAEHAAIKNAMARQGDNAVLQQIANATLSPDALQDLLAHAFLQNLSLVIKGALLHHPACDLPTRQAALALAVQHNDLPLAKQALQQGADPEKITARPQADAMRFLLTYARRKNKLYPPNASRDQDTDLDRALQNGLDDRAREAAWKLLSETASGKHAREGWRNAVKAKQLDVQRALLLLYADRDRGFRLLQEDAVTDQGVAEVMKEIPYFSPKRGLPQNFNCEARFPGTDEEIACRHLVEHRQSEQERSPQIKFDDAQFASTEVIAAHVSYDTEAKHDHLIVHATEARLLHNRDFGKGLVQQFAAMAAEGEASRLILLLSTNHAMSVQLRIKEKDGKPYYVAALFDPNRTASHVRIASDSLLTLETLTLKDLIDGEGRYNDYYPEPDGLSMMVVRPPAQEGQTMTGPARGVVENRTLTSSIEDKEITPTALFYMMTHGCAGDLRRLKGEIASRPEKERIALLAAKDDRGNIPGLYSALQNGHADAIKAFGELLLFVPEDQRAALLVAKNTDGVPGLYMALQNGHADAIKAFGKLLLLVPEDQRAALLAAKNADGVPGLFIALQEGHADANADAIKAFGELLSLVPEDQRAALLAAKNADSVPGLCMALYKGHAGAIKAFGELLLLVPEDQRAALLAAENANGIRGLCKALLQGHADAIEAFGELLLLVPEDQRAELLAAKSANGIPGLYMALLQGHADAIEAFGKLLLLVPEDQRAELLAAKDFKGFPGLYVALLQGHADAIEAFGKLLLLVPEDQRAALLAAKNANGVSGFYIALQRGHADAIKAFGKLLALVPEGQRAELLAAKDADGVPGLYLALQSGHADAIKMFGELLLLVPEGQRAELLAAKNANGRS